MLSSLKYGRASFSTGARLTLDCAACLLTLKRRVVLVDEYLTTKRCPTCRCTTHLTAEER